MAENGTEVGTIDSSVSTEQADSHRQRPIDSYRKPLKLYSRKEMARRNVA
jgi:hypothetical protein